MAADPGPVEMPSGPTSIEEVHQLLPSVRQSLVAGFDSCNLRALFDLRYGWWVSSPEAACGTIFHRIADECLRTMVRTGNTTIPVSEAFEIMWEVAAQREVDPWDRVVLPAHMWPRLRLCVLKFAQDNTFSIDRIVSIEEKLTAQVPYQMPDGTMITRTFTGSPDLLMFEAPDGAIVCDWKTGWGLPPAPRIQGETEVYIDSEKEAARGLSFTGYAQQRMYGYLVMKTYPSVQRVTLREVYVMRGQVRPATLYRADLEHVERELGIQLEQLDRAIAAGPRFAGTGLPRDPWPAQPGTACKWCLKSSSCPIDADVRGLKVIVSREEAEQRAKEFYVADSARGRLRDALKDWTGEHGPIEVKDSKGRKMIGVNVKPDGSQRFETFTPESSDKGMFPPDLPHTDPESDKRLEEAFSEAASGVSAARAKRRKTGRRII